MGVRGLTTYIAQHSDLYLVEYKLEDCYLVVDGNNIACHLFKTMAKNDTHLGGDYDDYYNIVYNFFMSLKRCNIKPIVLFDGGYEKKKINTVVSRAVTKLLTLKNCIRTSLFSSNFFPLFMKQVFWDAAKAMNVVCIQCPFEADNEIAAVARQLSCPVLSFDSDFYIYNVLYIPFPTLHLEPVWDSAKCFLKCSLYNVDKFLETFGGLDVSVLPLIAILLGNDYVERSLFDKFFNHLKLPKSKHASHTQKLVHGVLHWMKCETLETAIDNILLHVNNKDHPTIMAAIEGSITDYTKVCSFVKGLDGVDHYAFLAEIKNTNLTDLPNVTIEHLHECKIPSFFVDLITLNTYFSPLQVQDLTQPSTHISSILVITVIYQVLKKLTRKECDKHIKIFMKIDKRLDYQSVDIEKNGLLNDFDISQSTQDFMCNLLHINLNDKNIINQFPDAWQLFILSVIYWVQAQKGIPVTYGKAILLTAIFLQVVQKQVGYFKSLSALQRRKACVTHSEMSHCDTEHLTGILKSVSEMDCINVTHFFIPLHKSNNKCKGKNFSIPTIHTFATFQSCAYHIFYLNALLNFPFKSFKISDFYSGTLVYNIFLEVKRNPDVINSGLTSGVSIHNVYKFVFGLMEKYFLESEVRQKTEKSKKKKGKAKKTSTRPDSPASDSDVVSPDTFIDTNNPYYLLAECP